MACSATSLLLPFTAELARQEGAAQSLCFHVSFHTSHKFKQGAESTVWFRKMLGDWFLFRVLMTPFRDRLLKGIKGLLTEALRTLCFIYV